MAEITKATRLFLLRMQKNEITESFIYQGIAQYLPTSENREILSKISQEEEQHAKIWSEYTHVSPTPNKIKAFFYILCARFLGFTFTLKLMEGGEHSAQDIYSQYTQEVPEIKEIIVDEKRHETELLNLLDESRLRYVGSMVLGLNDALVELTGTLAGLTFALSDTRLVALSGLITGISATLSMASSEYLAARSDGRPDALKSCIYTGITYLIAVSLLIMPYLCFSKAHCGIALATMLGIVVVIIGCFTFYISVAKDLSFKKRFWEMFVISFSVAFISFGIGLLIKKFLNINGI